MAMIKSRDATPQDRERIEKWADFVYCRHGKVAHIKLHTEVATYPWALCGRSPQWTESWLGTGNQTECDTARGMPLCARCRDLADNRDA